MANTGATENGVYAWMASVRASMNNDPSRKIFENQIQSHAFLFLDNYLEHILAGPKQGPIIDLVKTPGRKRNVPRRTRAATAAAATMKSTVPFSLDDDYSTRNTVPVNSFHKALLQAKGRSVQDALDSATESPVDGPAENAHGPFDCIQPIDIPEITASAEPQSQINISPFQSCPTDPSSGMPFLVPEHDTHLSIIAEGDESPDRGYVTTLPLPSNPGELPRMVPQPCHQIKEHLTTQGSSETVQIDKLQGDPSPVVLYSVPPPADVDCFIPPDFHREVQSSEGYIGGHTEPLPPTTANSPPENYERRAFTAPLPLVPVSDSIPAPQTILVPLNDCSSETLPHKGGAAGFPTLPAPSPLRKSMRIAQDVPIGVVQPIAPAPVPLGKRTSWLMKAREAKAMEGTSLPSGASTSFPQVSTAAKRKSGEMLGELQPGRGIDKDQHKSKVAKAIEVTALPETKTTVQRDPSSAQGDPGTLPSAAAMPVYDSGSHAMNVDKQTTRLNSAEEGFIDLFKRTVEGLGARAAKSAEKSLGGTVVAALAEARAAAEARVAERNKVNTESGDSSGSPDQESTGIQAYDSHTPAGGTEQRLSLSDLATGTVPSTSEVAPIMVYSVEDGSQTNTGNDGVSMTPPDSPPSKGNLGFVKPAGPVFNKPPPPVFMPPTSKQSSITSTFPKKFASDSRTTKPVFLDIATGHITPSDVFPPLAQGPKSFARSLQPSILSDPLFDQHDGIPTRVASTQDDSDLQLHDPQPASVVVADDDDDSWPLEEKLAAAESGWRPFDFSNVEKEDTWSSLQTESQGPTKSLTTAIHDDGTPLCNDTDAEVDAKSEKSEPEKQVVEASDVERSILDSGKPEDLAEVGTSSLSSVNSEPATKNMSYTSMTTIPSQSQVGFFSQATRLVNNMLGGSKKVKPELKSLQLAAAAAKKQQEEADKKTQRLRDMDARRQLATAKRAEEEKTRLIEEEKKNKEEFERRKREREDNTDRRPKPPFSAKKADDDPSKKRKVALETEKKQETKNPSSRDKKDPAPQAKLAVTPATKAAVPKGAKGTNTALVSSTAYNATQNPLPAKSIAPELKPFKVASVSKGKAKAKPQEDDIGDKLPSTMVQSQMAARAKAQMQAEKAGIPQIASELIELPEINSEYSDSEDEGKVRTFDPPEWAQSPELRQALQMQSTVNPDDVFGEIRPLRMEEMFRTRQSRFRARTSSANWSGTDRLTVEEIREYERRMGFHSTDR